MLIEKSPDLLFTHEIIELASLPPVYSLTSPLLKNFKVGNPFTSYLSPKGLCTVASTFPKTTVLLLAFKVEAAALYSGSNFFYLI